MWLKLDDDRNAFWQECALHCIAMSAIVAHAVYSTGHPPVSPSLSSASTFAPAFTRAKMASALPEGQEALEVESACSENTPVGGQAHPISSNTTELRHTTTGFTQLVATQQSYVTLLQGMQQHTVHCTDRMCINRTRSCSNECLQCTVGNKDRHWYYRV